MPTIRLNTEVPGPESRALTERRYSRGSTRRLRLSAGLHSPRRRRGPRRRRRESLHRSGRRHRHHQRRTSQSPRAPAVHVSSMRFSTSAFLSPDTNLRGTRRKLNAITPGHFAKKTLLVNSGAEGVENAVKIARAHTGRPAVLCVEDAFHGRRCWACRHQQDPSVQAASGRFSDVYRIPYGQPAAARISRASAMSHEDVEQLLDGTFRRVVAAESVAAVISSRFSAKAASSYHPRDSAASPISAAGTASSSSPTKCRPGLVVPATIWVQHLGIEPDLILTAKSHGRGLPLAGVTGRAEIMDAPIPGGVGGTFGGNPASCAAALAVIEEFADGSLLLAPARSASTSNGEPMPGRGSIRLSATCADWGDAGDRVCRPRRCTLGCSGEKAGPALPAQRSVGAYGRHIR